MKPPWGFGLKVVMPVLLVLAVASVAAWMVLGQMAADVDRIEAESREKATRAALNSFLNRLAVSHGDYAVWDEAEDRLGGTIDEDFARDNYGESSRTGILFDGAYLVDEDGRQRFGYQDGQPALRDLESEFGPAIDRMIEQVRQRPRRYDVQTGFVTDHTGRIVAIAVGSIQPASADRRVKVGAVRVLVLSHVIEGASLERLSRDFVLGKLHFVRGNAEGDRGVPTLDPLGRQIATILWEPSTLGKLALLRIAPTAAIAAVLVCGTMGFLLWIGFRNLREVRRREQEALRTAGQDGLTGLPNRRGLSRELVDALSASRGASPVAVIYLDLDGFKEVNDAYGHEAGDRLLVMVADAFGAICKDRGLLARVGGDEFAVVVRDTWAGEGPGALAERMVRLLDEPFDIDGRQIQIGTSVGVAIARGEQASAEEMLRRADVAMYLAKEFGRNRVAFYDPSIDAARAERLRLAEDLRSALRHDRLALVYQPIFEARTMRPAGVEALLRWLHPQLGLVPPDKFIPIAEENGLIEPIGEWVLRRACADALAWPEVKLSVNVSPVQFRNPGFDLLLADVLADTGFPPSRLEIEMTETHLVANPDRARSIISSLRQIGVTIALDDFGTGYSSIGYLRRFSFDKLKLDRSLVVGVTSDPSARRLCEATIALARALDLRVTAEGVETEEEGAILRQAGCDQFQGYAYARPMTAETIGSFLIATLSRPMVMPWAS